MTLRTFALVAASFALAACEPKTAEQVGDKFVELYFVKIDQQAVLPFTTGLAKSKVEEELGLVAQVRKDVRPADSKPSIYTTRTATHIEGTRARLTYDLKIQQGRDETQRHTFVSVEEIGGLWKVSNFIVQEGSVPARPGEK